MLSQLQSFFTPDSPLILASQSPQRQEILQMMDISFRSVPSNFEEVIDPRLSPEKNVEALAEGKAQDVFQQFPDSFVVGVDTIVVSADGEICEKPKDRADAQRMITQKSGTIEQVISGICIMSPQGSITRHETAEIHFAEISTEDVEKLLENESEWKEKSGAICIEGRISLYTKKIVGNWWNIIGFPVPTFVKIMKELMD